jgi:hypothetical protein
MNTIELFDKFELEWNNKNLSKDIIIKTFQNTEWMFRTVDDEKVENIKINKGFIFPPNNKPGIYGLGGIYFGTSYNQILNYSKHKNHLIFKHCFACPILKNYILIENYVYELKKTYNNCDYYLKNVRNSNLLGDEIIKSGFENELYEPFILLWLKFK